MYCDALGESYVQASAKTIARVINEDPYKSEITDLITSEDTLEKE